METAGYALPVLLLILLVGLVIPELFKKFRLPYVTTLIIFGAILGPYALGLVEIDDTIRFFGFLGFTFLMFMAGLKTDMDEVKQAKKEVVYMTLLNGAFPFVIGFLIAYLLGYPLETALVLGVIFISSSVAIILPSVRSSKVFDKRSVNLLTAAVVLEDAVSLFLLALFFHYFAPMNDLPLWLYFIVLVASVWALKIILPKFANLLGSGNRFFSKSDYQNELRFVIAVLIAVLLFFELLGVHPILAAFLVGILLSKNLKSEEIYNKLHVLGYGLFVPVFFFIVGMELDFSVFTELGTAGVAVFLVVLGLIFSKAVGGYLGGRLAKFPHKDSALFGMLSTVQLTTTLAAVYAGLSLGFLDRTLVTAIILIAVVTTLFVPLILQFFTKKVEEQLSDN